MVDLLAAAGVHLGLHDLGGDEALEKGVQEGRSLQFGGGEDAEQTAGESGIPDVNLRRLDDALAEVFEIGRHQDDLPGELEYAKPFADGGDGDAERGREI